MNAKQALQLLKEHCVPALNSGILTENDRISVRDGDTAWIIRDGAKFSSLKESDLVAIALDGNISYEDKIAGVHALLYAKFRRLSAIVNNRNPYSLAVSVKGETVRPYVDDIAQIAGINIRCAELSDTGRIKSLFKRRSAVLIKDSGSLCADISLDDALAVAMITEKACRIHVQSGYLGGAKPINIFESALMRYIYVKKYSKIKY